MIRFCVLILSLAYAYDDVPEEYRFDWVDPDAKMYVLQNRHYTKAVHPVISLMGGGGYAQAYQSTFSIEPRFAFYMNEQFALEGVVTFIQNAPNNNLVALESAAKNTLPNIRQIRSQAAVFLQYAPWYGKINVSNNILHLDWYVAAGVGFLQSYVDVRTSVAQSSQYTQQSLTAGLIGTGNIIHITQTLKGRWDLTASFYPAPLDLTSGVTGWYSNYNLSVGLGVQL